MRLIELLKNLRILKLRFNDDSRIQKLSNLPSQEGQKYLKRKKILV